MSFYIFLLFIDSETNNKYFSSITLSFGGFLCFQFYFGILREYLATYGLWILAFIK